MGAGDLVFERFDCGADPVAQRAEPGAGGGFLVFDIVREGHDAVFDMNGHSVVIYAWTIRRWQRRCRSCRVLSKPSVWRRASPSTIAAETATLSERDPGRMGMRMRRSARLGHGVGHAGAFAADHQDVAGA